MVDVNPVLTQPIQVSTVVPRSDPNRTGSILISFFSLALLLGSLAFAYLIRSDNLMILLAGVIATNATTVVNYWVGSSSSSQIKDKTISGQLPPPTQ